MMYDESQDMTPEDWDGLVEWFAAQRHRYARSLEMAHVGPDYSWSFSIKNGELVSATFGPGRPPMDWSEWL